MNCFDFFVMCVGVWCLVFSVLGLWGSFFTTIVNTCFRSTNFRDSMTSSLLAAVVVSALLYGVLAYLGVSMTETIGASVSEPTKFTPTVAAV